MNEEHCDASLVKVVNVDGCSVTNMMITTSSVLHKNLIFSNGGDHGNDDNNSNKGDDGDDNDSDDGDDFSGVHVDLPSV